MKMIPNTTQIPNYIIDDVLPNLTDTELRVLIIICRQTYGWIEDKQTGRRKERDWISYSQLITKTGRHREAISNALRGLELKTLIEVYDKNGKRLLTRVERKGRQLFYRVSTSSESEQVAINQFGKRNSESELTKLIHTKNRSIPSLSSLPFQKGERRGQDNLQSKNGDLKTLTSYLTQTEPLNRIKDPVKFAARLDSAYGAKWVLNELKKIVASFAGTPEREDQVRNWERYISKCLKEAYGDPNQQAQLHELISNLASTRK